MTDQKRIAIALEIDLPYPHHQEVFVGVQRFANEKQDWQCVIDEHPGFAKNRRSETTAYDGIIARAPKSLQRRAKKQGVPMVNVYYDSHTQGIPGVYTAASTVGAMAAEHLIDRGFRRLLALIDTTYRQPREVAEAFHACAEGLGVESEVLDFREGAFRNSDTWVRFEKQLSSLLDRIEPPVGVFITNAPAARLFVQHARARGFHVPQDLAIICQYNIDLMVNVPPQITSIDHNFERVGYEAAVLLDRMMNGEAPPSEPVLVPPKGVIGRETTDYFAVTDEMVAEALVYISSRLHEKLRVEDIAYAINISPRSLQTRFGRALGVSVGAEIRRLRFEKAKRLLLESDRQIGSIPKEVGFATLYVMNQIFKRELGITPSAYRKKVLGKA